MEDYVFLPVPADHDPELDALGYSPAELIAVAHLSQLAASLACGEIGFEWFRGLSQRELAAVGWG